MICVGVKDDVKETPYHLRYRITNDFVIELQWKLAKRNNKPIIYVQTEVWALLLQLWSQRWWPHEVYPLSNKMCQNLCFELFRYDWHSGKYVCFYIFSVYKNNSYISMCVSNINYVSLNFLTIYIKWYFPQNCRERV